MTKDETDETILGLRHLREMLDHRIATLVRETHGATVPVQLMSWMADHGYATGHGDTLEDVLDELNGQIIELCERVVRELRSETNMPLTRADYLAAIRALKDKP